MTHPATPTDLLCGSEDMLRHLLVSVSDDDGCILYVNDLFCHAYGYSREELLGSHYAQLDSGLHDSAFFATLWETIRAGRPWTGEIANRHKDGSVFWRQVTIIPLPASDDKPVRYIALGSDISRRVSAEAQLRGSESRFRMLTDTMRAGVVVQRNKQTVYTNPAMTELTGYSTEELLASPFDVVCHPDFRDTLHTISSSRLQGAKAPSQYEMPILTKAGEKRWAEVSVSTYEIDGETTVIGTFTDTTERKRIEANQKQLHRLLSQIIDSDPVPTFVINSQHVITHWNQACAVVTGMQPMKILGSRRAWSAFYQEERPVLANLIVESKGSAERMAELYGDRCHPSPVIPGAYEAEGYFAHLGENGRWLQFTAAPLCDQHGKVIGAVETLIDITERKQAEASLQQAHDELEQLVEKRTSQLAKAKQALAEDAELRQNSEEALRQRDADLSTAHARLLKLQEQLRQTQPAGGSTEQNSAIASLTEPLASARNDLEILAGHLGTVHDANNTVLPTDIASRLDQLRQTLTLLNETVTHLVTGGTRPPAE